MNTASELTPFRIRVCAIEEGPGSVLRLPPFQSTAVEALARVDHVNGTAQLAWMPLRDGLNLGLEETEFQCVRGRLYEVAVQKLGRLLMGKARAADEAPIIDVALPCLDKRMAANRSAHWACVDGSAEFGGFAQAIAAGWLAAARGETEVPPMEWTLDLEMSGATANAILAPLLESYRGYEQELPHWATDENYKVDFHVSLDGAAAAGWYHLGSERTYDFFRKLARVSSAAQTAIRRWLPVLWLGDGMMFSHSREAAALLAYASLPAIVARSRRNYTYDPLDAISVKQALLHSGRKIQRQLQIWYPALVAMKHDSAEQLHPRWHSRWAAELSRHCKRIQTLLANEAWLIDQLVNYGAQFQSHASGAELTGTIRWARTFHASLERRFRRWWDGTAGDGVAGASVAGGDVRTLGCARASYGHGQTDRGQRSTAGPHRTTRFTLCFDAGGCAAVE